MNKAIIIIVSILAIIVVSGLIWNWTQNKDNVESNESESIQYVPSYQVPMYTPLPAYQPNNDLLNQYGLPQVNPRPISTQQTYLQPQDVLPQDMNSVAHEQVLAQPTSYTYNRLIFANQKRKNLRGSDYIRGDLPICPTKHEYIISAKPALDLNQGAMGMIAPPMLSNTYEPSRLVSVLNGEDLAVSQCN